MAGISISSSILSSRSKLRTTWLQFETRPRRTMSGKSIRRRNLKIRVDVDYVNAEEAKKLIAVEDYAIIDIRDKSQFKRAHIKSCYHVPLFIENQDSDLGTIIKRTVHNNFSGLFFGLPFTKLNPEFVQSVKSQFSPESKLLLVCQEGLRSAAAANKLRGCWFPKHNMHHIRASSRKTMLKLLLLTLLFTFYTSSSCTQGYEKEFPFCSCSVPMASAPTKDGPADERARGLSPKSEQLLGKVCSNPTGGWSKCGCLG